MGVEFKWTDWRKHAFSLFDCEEPHPEWRGIYPFIIERKEKNGSTTSTDSSISDSSRT